MLSIVFSMQVLGHTGASNLVDFPGDPFQGMNMDDVFGSFRRPGNSDRRRTTTYRPFPDRPGGERGGAFHHPLLTRPSATPGGGVTTAIASNLWPTTSSIVRDAEAMLGGIGGGALDVTHFYMYDAPMITEHTAEGLFGERGLGGAPPLLDFTMDPVYLMGRRGGRTESRLSSWTDDGQPQAGAHAASIAQAIEDQFIEQLRLLVPSAEPVADQSPAVAAESAEPVARRDRIEDEDPQFSAPVAHSSMGEQAGDVLADPPNEGGVGSTGRDVTGRLDSGSATVNQSSADLDVQMQDERNEPVARDTEANSQDSGGSGATVGESLRSLEVEIGSADGHDEGDRHPGPERLVAGELQPSTGVERVTSSSRRSEQGGDIDEDMEGAGTAGSHQDGGGSADERPSARSGEEEAAPTAASGGAQASRDPAEAPDANVSSIDPTFLEALPADLRAEVLASQQTRAVRPANPAPPAPPEEIDPEFLAALPPDIQAEVLAQQRAQRAVIAQTIEGQPVDMDSASIIATFPAELREEVNFAFCDLHKPLILVVLVPKFGLSSCAVKYIFLVLNKF